MTDKEQTEKENVTLETVTLTINDRSVTVPKGTTVYHACTAQGIDIPIFCYQDRMPPFGACRVCLVEVDKMGKLQTSCTLVATEGMVVKTESALAAEGRKEILELLLINHPLDCPICDRGGECPLQDQALKFGPGESRFYEEKRHFTKAKPLGPVLMLDRERCIACARCTRFGDEVAGDNALEFHERGFRTEVGTPDGGPAKSKFIGNTIMICPVGALTSQVYRFRARPWDNKPTATTCTLCPVGCSMFLDSRDGEIMRTRSNENRDVNDIWMCDKGWFGYEFVSSKERLSRPLIRKDGKLQPSGWEEALTLIAQKMLLSKSGGKIAALGGNPLTTEENYLYQQLIREGVGVNNIDHRVGMPIFSEDEGAGLMEMSLGDCEELGCAFLFGVDLTEEFPVVWLRLRQAINKGASVSFAGHYSPEIAPHLTNVYLHTPGEELAAIKHMSDAIKECISAKKRGAIFIGDQYLNTPLRSAIIAELRQLVKGQARISINFLTGRGNSHGARLAGMRPDTGPFGASVGKPGLNAAEIIETAAQSGWDYIHVAGADPAAKCPQELWNRARKNLGFLVVQDLFLTETARHADVVLPALSYTEKNGTFLNIEGRIQALQPGKDIPEGVFSDGEIFERIAQKMGFSLGFEPSFTASLKVGHRQQPYQQKELNVQKTPSPSAMKFPGFRASFAHRLFDEGVRMQHDPHTSKLAAKPVVRLHSADAIEKGLRQGERVVVRSGIHSFVGELAIDDGVAQKTAVIPLGFKSLPAFELGTRLINGMAVEVERHIRAQGGTSHDE